MLRIKDAWETFEDTRGSIRSRKSKKNRQYNGQMKKDIHLQNTTQKTKHETHKKLKTGGELSKTF